MAVNSRSDLATFQSVARSLGLPTDNLLLCGLPLLSGRYRDVPADTPIKTVMFADQPTVPQTREDRLYVYQRLMAYALALPTARSCSSPGTVSRRTLSTGCSSVRTRTRRSTALLAIGPYPPNARQSSCKSTAHGVWTELETMCGGVGVMLPWPP